MPQYKVLEESPLSVRVEDERGDEFWLPREEFDKRTAVKESKTRVKREHPISRTSFSFNPIIWPRVIEILQSDIEFRMPISTPPIDQIRVEDEISDAEKGMTIATDSKLFISYDVVFSKNEELEILLEQMGVQSKPFFDNDGIRLAHGPRKAFYMKLLDSGFEPSKLEGGR